MREFAKTPESCKYIYLLDSFSVSPQCGLTRAAGQRYLTTTTIRLTDFQHFRTDKLVQTPHLLVLVLQKDKASFHHAVIVGQALREANSEIWKVLPSIWEVESMPSEGTQLGMSIDESLVCHQYNTPLPVPSGAVPVYGKTCPELTSTLPASLD